MTDFTVESGKTRDLVTALKNLAAQERTVVILKDDDAMLRETTRQLLENLGYKVHTAAGGVDAMSSMPESRTAAGVRPTSRTMDRRELGGPALKHSAIEASRFTGLHSSRHLADPSFSCPVCNGSHRPTGDARSTLLHPINGRDRTEPPSPPRLVGMSCNPMANERVHPTRVR